jgi:HPt (histidine-containing phosphotransfer) domain-containing protein
MNDFVSKPYTREIISKVINLYQKKDNTNTKLVLIKNEKVIIGNLTHFDYQEMKTAMDMNEDFIKEMLRAAKLELDKGVVVLKTCLEQKNIKNIKSAAHKMKGTALILKANMLIEMTRKLEDQAFADNDLLSKLIKEIESEVKIVISLIDEVL